MIRQNGKKFIIQELEGMFSDIKEQESSLIPCLALEETL